MDALGIRLVEIERWNCCGTVYSLAEDDLAHHLAPVRNLIRVKEQGGDRVGTLCSFCYHTLKRANLLVQKDPEKRQTLNDFMEEESDYGGEVQVVHLLEVLRDEVGWEAIAEKVRVPLQGLKVAPYYGCTLLRPQEVAIDQVERPAILHQLMAALGAEAVDFPYATECCGAFQIVGNPDSITQRAWEIVSSAMRCGAEALVLTCPLCHFNLSQRQPELVQQHSDFTGMPVFYFTQLLAIALGIDPEVCHFELSDDDPLSLLKSKKLVS
jgi:heterodisulfide reductase subunit B